MCYLVRQQQSAADAATVDSFAPPPFQGVRPRWAGAAAATLVGGLALAAMLASPPAGPDSVAVRNPGAPAPVAARSSNVPGTPGLEQTALPMDDGVPTAADTGRGAGIGHCHHGL